MTSFRPAPHLAFAIVSLALALAAAVAGTRPHHIYAETWRAASVAQDQHASGGRP